MARKTKTTLSKRFYVKDGKTFITNLKPEAKRKKMDKHVENTPSFLARGIFAAAFKKADIKNKHMKKIIENSLTKYKKYGSYRNKPSQQSKTIKNSSSKSKKS